VGTFVWRGHSRDCPVELAFAVIGQRWKARILFRLAGGMHRFAALRAELPGISDKVLTTALRELERDGLISRTVHAEVPPRVEYRITAEGLALWQAAEPLRRWGLAYRA
jgi:DNA-binding HxlR family transcriptional regulator